MKLKVGVLFGGESVEHEISVISAIQAMNNFDTDKYEIIPIYMSKEKEWYTSELLKEMENYRDIEMLKNSCKNVVLYKNKNAYILQSKKGFKSTVKELDIIFPIVHGFNTEDGSVAGYLSLIGIPFVGSDIYASVVGQDKIFMKQVFLSEKLPVVKYVWFFDCEYTDDEESVINKIKTLKLPVIIKPSRLGSSIGITKVSKWENLKEALEDALEYDSKIIIEEAIENLKEVNQSVLGNYENQELSELEEVISGDEILSYKDKYMSGSKKTKGMASAGRIIPANISIETREKINSLSKRVFKSLNSSGVVRIDYLIDKANNEVYVNEINTIPGSLSFYLWKPLGKDYKTLLDDMINSAIRSYKRKSKKTSSFKTDILKDFNPNKGLKGKLKI